MIDSELAELYGVETKRLNEQIKRNQDCFSDDFMFTLTAEEWQDLNPSWSDRKMRLQEVGVAEESCPVCLPNMVY